MIGDNGYYSLRALLGYASDPEMRIFILLTERGLGKTWAIRKWLIEKEGTAMCLYRQGPDMRSALDTWLDPIVAQGFAAERFSWKLDGDEKKKTNPDAATLLMDGSPKIYFRTLNQVNSIKQEVFPDSLDWVFFDEFIPFTYKKLPGVDSEGTALLTILKTIDHDTAHPRISRGLNPVRCLMVGNPFTWSNPLLQFFRVRPKYGIQRVGPGIVCEMIEPKDSQVRHRTLEDFVGEDPAKSRGWEDQLAYVLDRWPKGLQPFASVRFGTRSFWLFESPNAVSIWYVKMFTDSIFESRAFGPVSDLRECECAFPGSNLERILEKMNRSGRLRFADENTKFEFLAEIIK